MIRALLELIFTVIAVVVARMILTSLLRGVANASQGAFRNRQPGGPIQNRGSAPSPAQSAGDLHKDPVCGTYVAESTPFRRQIGRQNFYYCSDACREKHSLVAR